MRSSLLLCLVCKGCCIGSQKTNCSICKLPVHLKCVNVGLNYGIRNYICMSCHQKPKQRAETPPPSQNSSDNDDSQNVSSAVSLNHTGQNCPDINDNCFDLDAINERIRTANENNMEIGPTETADLYVSLNQLSSALQIKTHNDIFAIHFNARSWVKHFDSFTSFFDRMTHRPEIICVSETRLKDGKIDWQNIY